MMKDTEHGVNCVFMYLLIEKEGEGGSTDIVVDKIPPLVISTEEDSGEAG